MSKSFLRGIGFIVSLAMAGSVQAAEQPELDLDGYQPKGFLSDYSKLAPEEQGSDAFLFEDQRADWSKYKALVIDRIQVFVKEDAEYKGIDPAELKELADYFHEAIQKATSETLPAVNEIGPDVLRLRVAITDLVPNKPEASVVSLVVPFIWAGEAGAGAVEQGEVGSTPFTGEVTIEAEAMDSVSGEQLAAYIETKVGSKYSWHKGLKKGVSDYVGAYSTWTYTKNAMDGWAELIGERLKAARAGAEQR